MQGYEQNDQTFWVAENFENAERRPAWNTWSPWIAAMRLNSGLGVEVRLKWRIRYQYAHVNALRFPVPNGEPYEESGQGAG